MYGDIILASLSHVCAAPSHQPENLLGKNPAIVQLKELFMENLLMDKTEFEDIKKRINQVNMQMKGLEQNF